MEEEEEEEEERPAGGDTPDHIFNLKNLSCSPESPCYMFAIQWTGSGVLQILIINIILKTNY